MEQLSAERKSKITRFKAQREMEKKVAVSIRRLISPFLIVPHLIHLNLISYNINPSNINLSSSYISLSY